jgi:phage-related protein
VKRPGSGGIRGRLGRQRARCATSVTGTVYSKFAIMPDRDLEYWDDDGSGFLETVRSWPKAVREAIGADIRRVQRGQEPKHWRPLTGFPVAAGEVKHKASGARVVYSVAYVSLSGKVFIADAFLKDAAEGSEMRPPVRRRIEARLRQYRQKYDAIKRKKLH